MGTRLCAPLLCCLLASPIVAAGEYGGKEVTFSIRPKLGVLVPFEGDLDVVLDEHFHGELGFKGTIDHWGIEFSGGGRYARESFQGIDFDSVIGLIKFTGTYELNPMAGREGGHGPGNLYFGAGMGLYPSELESTVTVNGTPISGKSSFFGYGPHAVIGGEYFLSSVVGVFAELEYSYTIFDIDPGLPDLDLHAFSLLVGLSLRF